MKVTNSDEHLCPVCGRQMTRSIGKKGTIAEGIDEWFCRKCGHCEDHDSADRERFFRAQAMRIVLLLYDEGVYMERRGREMSIDQPGVDYAVEHGWITRTRGVYWLTSAGIVLGGELASEREDWFFAMADKLKDGEKS